MKKIEHNYDFVVVGGGLTGLCAAVTAARQGTKTVLIQDRPVLGGNASKEICVPPVGASNCNFAYSRETGLIEELYLNNLRNNPTWSWEGWNLEYESLVHNEPNLDRFLNCAISDVKMVERRIVSVKGYCSPDETWHEFSAPLFLDCSGDGVVGAGAGATFRMGIEARAEFDEDMCEEEPQNVTMGNSLQLRARDAGRPVPFTRPAWVDNELNIEDFGPYRRVCDGFFPDTGGFWWLEWGGDLDTIHQSELIKDEVQKLVLAVWDFLKNRSDLAEKLSTYELEWMGSVSAKRESRRFEGDHILTMGDIDNQVHFDDALAYGGWGFDHHPPGGFYDKVNPSIHRYLRGPHSIPLRSLYSKNVDNLFVAGRNISATHYALSSTRVMLTCAQLGTGVGMAAAHGVKSAKLPRELTDGDTIREIQKDLIVSDHHLHTFPLEDSNNIAPQAKVHASSVYAGQDTPKSWGIDTLTDKRMLKLPVVTAQLETISLLIDAAEATRIRYSVWNGPENNSTYPEDLVAEGELMVEAGKGQWCDLEIAAEIIRPGWHFLILEENPAIALHLTEAPVGYRRYYPRPEDPIRPNVFSKWDARPIIIGSEQCMDLIGAATPVLQWNDHAKKYGDESCFLNFAFCAQIKPVQPVYSPAETISPHSRPTNTPGLWVSGTTDFSKPEWLTLSWESPQSVSRIQVLFDSSLHFHFWQGWSGYPMNAIPSIVKDYRIIATLEDESEVVIAEVENNHQRNCKHVAELQGVTDLRLECHATHGIDRAQVYSLRVFG